MPYLNFCGGYFITCCYTFSLEHVQLLTNENEYGFEHGGSRRSQITVWSVWWLFHNFNIGSSPHTKSEMVYQHGSDMQLLQSCGTLNFALSGYPQQSHGQCIQCLSGDIYTKFLENEMPALLRDSSFLHTHARACTHAQIY